MSKPILQLKKFSPTTEVPLYQTAQAVGFDLASSIETTIAPHTVAYLPLGLGVKVPPGYWLALVARSSLHKLGLQLINGVGIVDPDYCGPDDELRAILYNFSDQPATIKVGDRLLQGILLPFVQAEFEPTTDFPAPNRGGIGSTGLK